MKIGNIFLDSAKETLKEDHKRKDVGFTDDDKKKIKEKITTKNESCLIALVGPYGAGKSTLLHDILPDEHSIEFDAWKVPDRKALWDALVLECSQDTEKYRKILNQGKDSEKAKFINGIGAILSAIPYAGMITEGVAKGLVAFFLNTSPAKRIEEFQKFFFEIIRDEKKFEDKKYIILEDTDRSGAEGLAFLETLSHFIKKNLINLENRSVTFIAPINDTEFYEKFQRYEKVFDYVEFLPTLKKDISEFANTVFTKEYLKRAEGKQLIILLKNLEQREKITLRTIKLILRKAYSNFEALTNTEFIPNFNLCVLFESCRYIKSHEKGRENESLYETYNRNGFVSGNTFESSFLHMVLDKRDEMIDSPFEFNINDEKRSDPWPDNDNNFIKQNEEKKFYVSKTYLRI